MHDKKLRREAMVKRYTLQQLLEHAANKEDIDRQAPDMEGKLPAVEERVKRVHPKRPWKPTKKHKHKQPQDNKKENSCQFCGIDHKGPRSKCPASGKICALCSKKRPFWSQVQRRKQTERTPMETTVNCKACSAGGKGELVRFRFCIPDQRRQA